MKDSWSENNIKYAKVRLYYEWIIVEKKKIDRNHVLNERFKKIMCKSALQMIKNEIWDMRYETVSQLPGLSRTIYFEMFFLYVEGNQKEIIGANLLKKKNKKQQFANEGFPSNNWSCLHAVVWFFFFYKGIHIICSKEMLILVSLWWCYNHACLVLLSSYNFLKKYKIN